MKRSAGTDATSGWWRMLSEPAPPRRLEGAERVDAAVLGAGFTGLAVALRLAEARPSWRVALVEAARVGMGSSGRNSGFVGHLSHRDPGSGIEETSRSSRVARFGRDRLGELVRRHAIACDWAEIGRLHVAVEDRALRNLDHLKATLAALGEAHRDLDAGALTAITGTEYYRAGVHVAGTALAQPAALARGLAAALPENVALFEDTPVLSAHPGAPHRLEAERGRLVADRLFLCTNGHTPSLGFLKRRIFPLSTYASLTRPLDDGERERMGGSAEWGLVSEDRMGSTMRRTRDGRVLVRNSVRYRPGRNALARVREVHRRCLIARYPGLAGVELQYTWGGVMGMTMNQGQYFGRLAPELYASVGYNGTGVAMGTGSGILLADLALGEDSSLVADALALRLPAWLPPEPLLGVGVRVATSYLQSRAGREL